MLGAAAPRAGHLTVSSTHLEHEIEAPIGVGKVPDRFNQIAGFGAFHTPRVGPEGLEVTVETLLLDLAAKFIPENRNQRAETIHPFATDELAQFIRVLARQLGRRASDLLPGFAKAEGAIDVSISQPEEWHRPRVIIEIVEWAADIHSRPRPAGFFHGALRVFESRRRSFL